MNKEMPSPPFPLDDEGLPMKCNDCRFYLGDVVSGRCRHDPPTMFLVGARMNALGQQEPMFLSEWPPINGDRWCGQFKRPEAKAAVELMPIINIPVPEAPTEPAPEEDA